MDEKNKFETEIDFMALPKSPSRLFGWIFPYYAVLFVIVGVYFVKNMDTASFNEVHAIYTDSLEINANVDVKMGGIMPAVDLDIILNPSSEIVEKGKTLYKTNCASCHGDNGQGDGLAAAALNPAPRNFKNLEGWTKGYDLINIYNTVQKGIAGTAMIAYEYLPIEDRIAIIHYVRTFAEYPAITEDLVAELDNSYDLSKGVETSNTISLEMAAEKLTEENNIILTNVEEIISRINSVQDKKIVELFNRSVYDKEKAISIFKREFKKGKSLEGFVNRLIASPGESGFKPNVSFLTKEELNSLYLLLSNSIS